MPTDFARRVASVSILAIAIVSVHEMALAQEAAAATENRGGLEEILVTARKRIEGVQDVPVAVSAISAQTIKDRDLTSLDKIAAATPQFTVGRASNGSGAQMTLRGIGSSSTSIGTSSRLPRLSTASIMAKGGSSMRASSIFPASR
jgi:outer membrane receptor protein involved in Fe transport